MKLTAKLGVILLPLAVGLWWIRATKTNQPEATAEAGITTTATARLGTTRLDNPPPRNPPPRNPPPAVIANSTPSIPTPGNSPGRRILVFGEQGPVTMPDIPTGRFRDELLALSDAARARALSALGQLRIPVNNITSLHVDPLGMLFFACAKAPDEAFEGAPHSHPVAAGITDATDRGASRAADIFVVSVPISTPPIRHSKAGSSRTIYLDFNGHVVTGTSWNSAAAAPVSYVCLPYDTDGNSGSFNPAEQAGIVQIWERVAESFRAFDIDVTTEEPRAFSSQTARILITKERDANGVANPQSATAIGVAYLNVFGTAAYATVSNVAFVYQGTLTESRIAAVASHEAGHHMGLSHDGTSTVEYYAGHGGGETSWAPIMGCGTRAVLQWSKGEYFNANNSQDDLAIIAGKLTGRPDDHSGGDFTATPLIADGSSVQHRGVLETTGDTDTFTFSTAGGPVALRIGPSPNDLVSNRVSIDIVAEVRDAAGSLLARSDPVDSPTATFGDTLPAGTYFLRVTGTGTGAPLANPPSGYTTYGSVGAYTITGTMVPPAAIAPAAVVQDPESQSHFPGSSAVFSVIARGNPATTYAWERSTDGGANWARLDDDGTLTGAATSALTISKLTLVMNGDRFRCVVGNSAGSATSAAAILTINPPPPPTLPAFSPIPIVGTFGRGIPSGTSQNLTASLTAGSDPITLRWQLDGVDIPDADGPTYFLRNWQAAHSGVYRVVATNAAGSVISPGYTQYVSPEGGWQWRNPLPTGNGLSRAAFLNGQFIVGGLRGTLLTSADGTNWTTRTIPAANNLFGFHFFNGLHVALGSLGVVFTSPDAVYWTPRNSGTVHRDAGSGLQDMALGDGRLVAVGLGGLTTTSTDGINWTPGTAGTTEDLTGVAFAFDRFHAVSVVSGRIYSTTDGVAWTSLSTSSSALRRIAFGAGRLVAVGNSGETYTSTNGTTWTGGSAATAESFIGINFVNGQFVAVGTGGVIRTSPDGLTWSARSSGGNRSSLQNTAFGNGVYVIPGQAGTAGRALLVSSDGVTWRETVAGVGAVGTTLRGVSTSPNGLVAVGTTGTILHSTDGTRWAARPSGTSAQLNDVNFGSGLLVAVGNNGVVVTSPDGVAWSTQPPPVNLALNGVRFDNSLWVIVASSGRILTSPNGSGWTQRFNGGAVVLNKSAFGNGLHVVVGASGVIVVSPDGTNWTTVASGRPDTLNDVTFAGGRFVAVGAGGVVLTSTDGTAWTDRSFSSDALTSVTHAFGHFVATGPGSTYYVSTDGSSWIGRFTGTNDAMLDAAVLDDHLFVVGENSNILAAGAPLIGAPNSQETVVGSPVTLIASASASAFPLAYQWTKDDVALAGATAPTFTISRATAADSGRYRITATGPQGPVTSGASMVSVSPPNPGRIVNLSVRATAGAGAQTLITGFFVSAGSSKTVLIRGIGPGLAALGVSGAIADPQLQLFSVSSTTPLASNDNWGGGALTALSASVGAFPLDPTGRDAALQQTLASGAYTAQVTGPVGAGGVALVELYDSDPTTANALGRLVNVSARAQIGTDGNILIAGFSVSGNVPRTVLVRSVGPALAAFGVADALVDPQLGIYRGSTLLYHNDNWGTNASASGVAELAGTFIRVGAFALPNSTSRDAVLLLTLAPGSYTAQISGVNNTTGVALVEVYEVP